jgi:hypothetical protein
MDLKNFGSREVFGSKSVSLAVVALILSIVIAGVAFILLSVVSAKLSKDPNLQLAASIPIVIRLFVLGLFISAFICIWFLLYMQYNKEAEDIYSILRKKLVGKWNAGYEIYPGQFGDVGFKPNAIADIIIDSVTKKLEISFKVQPNPILSDGDQVVRMVALLDESNNKYMLSYYLKSTYRLNNLVAQHLLNDDSKTSVDKLLVEVFAKLSFENTDVIDKMTGEWFDLNGNLIKLYALLPEIEVHRDDEKVFHKKFSEAKVTHANFSALMGTISYTR